MACESGKNDSHAPDEKSIEKYAIGHEGGWILHSARTTFSVTPAATVQAASF